MNSQLIELIVNVGFGAVLLIIGFTAGRFAERKHIRSLDAREGAMSHMLVTDFKSFPGITPSGMSGGGRLVTGGAVISTDYFKTFIATIKKVIGGELGTYQTLVTRARREAVLRMLEEARSHGFDAVCNVRLDGYDIGGASKGGSGKGVVSVAVQASGTAYRRGMAAVAGSSGGVSRGGSAGGGIAASMHTPAAV